MKGAPGIHWTGCWVTYSTDFYPVPPDLLFTIIPAKITIILKVNFCCVLLGFIFRKSWVPFLLEASYINFLSQSLLSLSNK
jgi:energy-converting hydrogenase Eha subunit G